MAGRKPRVDERSSDERDPEERSSAVDRKHTKIYRVRRRDKAHILGTTLRRHFSRKIEEWNKRMTIRLIGTWISPRKTHVPINPLQIKSILFIRTDSIGDMVLSTAAWRVLKKRYPHLQIGVVGSFRNLPVIEHDPDIDFRYECTAATPKEVFRTAREARKHRWDLVMPLIYNKKTKMAILAKCFAPGAPASMALLPDDPLWRYEKLFSINIRTDYDNNLAPLTELMREHFEKTFGITIPIEEWKLSLRMDDAEMASVSAAVRARLAGRPSSRYVHMNLEARTAFREYGIENSFRLSKKIVEAYPELSVIWTTSPAAASKVEEYLAANPTQGIYFQPTKSIQDVIGIVRGADLVISPDTSLIHIASAERKPVVGLYVYPNEWPPYQVPNVVLFPERGEPVATIPVSDVLEAVKQLLVHTRAIQNSASLVQTIETTNPTSAGK